MSVTIAPHSWAAPQGARSGSAWRFGREVAIDADGSVRTALQWVLARNCSITPRQLATVYGALWLVSALISAGFWMRGAPIVGAFAGVELLLVGLALLAYARHAGDREVLTLAGRSLAVEQHLGARVERADFRADWLSVEPSAGQGSLVQLSSRGQTLRVGRFLRPELRAVFAQELRRALRRAGGPGTGQDSELK